MRETAAIFLVLSIVIGFMPIWLLVHAESDTVEAYELYPIPQNIHYDGESYILRNKVNIVYDKEIDEDTKSRLDEVLEIKSLTAKESTEFDKTH